MFSTFNSAKNSTTNNEIVPYTICPFKLPVITKLR